MKITFVVNNEEKEVQCSAGETILSVAKRNNLLHGNCEGFGVCGSCHVIIENLQDKLPPISESENNTLDKVRHVTTKSRLACQITLTDEMNGLKIRVPR